MDDKEFERYLVYLCEGLGHVDRHSGMRAYCTGLMSSLARKTVEPMAALMDSTRVSSRHQALHHFVADANWSDEEMLRRIAQWVVPLMDFSAGGWWDVREVGFPKQGKYSVGVARQSCPPSGRRLNCQVGISVSLVSWAASMPLAWRLYLPDEWADDLARRQKAGVPNAVEFLTKPTIALRQIEHLLLQGFPRHCVLADTDFGAETQFRNRLTELGLQYLVGVPSDMKICLTERRHGGANREAHQSNAARSSRRQLLTVRQLAFNLDPSDLQAIEWQDGSRGTQGSLFAAMQVRSGSSSQIESRLNQQSEWLLIEWPTGQREPTNYWLSTLPANTSMDRLAKAAKMRWRCQLDHHVLMQELGLGHYEGRGWRGFHHHASMSIAAYGFMLAQRLCKPPPSDGSTLIEKYECSPMR